VDIATLTKGRLEELAADRGGRCNARAIEHGIARRFWNAVALTLGLTAAVAAGLAALIISVGADEGSPEALVGAALAAAAAILGTIDATVLKPQAKAGAHERAGVDFELLRSDWEHFRDVTLAAVPLEEAGRSYQTFHQRQQSLGSSAPPISEWVRHRRERS
jgi:hypothetical protein